jgi:inner membrane protein
MDSLTQLVLGATTCVLIAPKTHIKRAALYGMVLGTLPDLDVFYNHHNPILNMVLHRSMTHSLYVLSCAALLIFMLCALFDGKLRYQKQNYYEEYSINKSLWYLRWLGAFWLALITHPLLDWFTIYGTQLFWPFNKTPYGLGNIFIIDLVFTIPLIIATIICFKKHMHNSKKIVYLHLCCMFSCLYLIVSLLFQYKVNNDVSHYLKKQNIHIQQNQLLVSASPFNILVWRVVLRLPNEYRETYVSIFADHARTDELIWKKIKIDDIWIAKLQHIDNAKRMMLFTHGFFSITQDSNKQLYITDLRMGSEPYYNFSFKVAHIDAQNNIIPVEVQRRERENNNPYGYYLKWLFQRIYKQASEL